MWNSLRRPSDDNYDDGSPTDQSNDPRIAAVNALASFSQVYNSNNSVFHPSVSMGIGVPAPMDAYLPQQSSVPAAANLYPYPHASASSLGSRNGLQQPPYVAPPPREYTGDLDYSTGRHHHHIHHPHQLHHHSQQVHTSPSLRDPAALPHDLHYQIHRQQSIDHEYNSPAVANIHRRQDQLYQQLNHFSNHLQPPPQPQQQQQQPPWGESTHDWRVQTSLSQQPDQRYDDSEDDSADTSDHDDKQYDQQNGDKSQPMLSSQHKEQNSRMEYSDADEEEDDNEDEDDDDGHHYDVNESKPLQESRTPAAAPRGKPEAMAAKLAAVQMAAQRQELEEEEQRQRNLAAAVAARAAAAAQEAATDTDTDEEDDDKNGGDYSKENNTRAAYTSVEPVNAYKNQDDNEVEQLNTARTVVAPSSLAPTKPKAKKRSLVKVTKEIDQPLSNSRTELLLSEEAPGITPEEYENLEALMVRFCKVPLLAEFSRPVSLLHPELMASYSKVVSRPVDLGLICRGIRRRQYVNTRDVRLDMWRVFANCVKFHSHPPNKDAVPSFVSIALHLREYFNHLWQEYMLPSDLPEKSSEVVKMAFLKRADDRRKRIDNIGFIVLSKIFIRKTAEILGEFIDNEGCVDKLDKEPVLRLNELSVDKDLYVIVENLRNFQRRLESFAENVDSGEQLEEYKLEALGNDIKACYTEDVLEGNRALQMRIGNRVDRLLSRRTIPLYEANSRGVTQSSIWGNVAAAVWARESSKKPYWPALCLGILPPEAQREGWHEAVTERNESRLPTKLRLQLLAAKAKCELAQKRQVLSYFLVEFLGTHEFIWVRETDIIERFDPENDPNKNVSSGSKKKRSSRSGTNSVIGSKTYATALEECTWACDEYETMMQDAMDEGAEDLQGEEEEDMNYSYALLAQSDDEADEEDNHGFQYDEDTMGTSDAEEANCLLANDGLAENGLVNRKKSKKKITAVKKKTEKEKEVVEKLKKDKKEVRKPTTESAKAKDLTKTNDLVKNKEAQKVKETSKAKEVTKLKEVAIKKATLKNIAETKAETKAELQKQRLRDRDEKKEVKELEKRRKKRSRDREKAIKDEARKQKRRRATSFDSYDDDRGLSCDKKARATAIVRAYIMRMAKDDDYRSLALNGVMTIPAAMVDSTGLLGMALALRAASGELTMPDDDADVITKAAKPWTAIDTKSSRLSAERVQRLQHQISLLEKEISCVKANTQRRKNLTKSVVAERLAIEREAEADDLAARMNFYKKKKKICSKEIKEQGGGEKEVESQRGNEAEDKDIPTNESLQSSHIEDRNEVYDESAVVENDNISSDDDDDDDAAENSSLVALELNNLSA